MTTKGKNFFYYFIKKIERKEKAAYQITYKIKVGIARIIRFCFREKNLDL
jgi:hypothetical protein